MRPEKCPRCKRRVVCGWGLCGPCWQDLACLLINQIERGSQETVAKFATGPSDYPKLREHMDFGRIRVPGHISAPPAPIPAPQEGENDA